MALWLLIGIFFVLLLMAVPIALAMGFAGLVAILNIGRIPLTLFPQRLFSAVNSFPLMAVPYFILAGLVMNSAGLTKRLVAFSDALVGHFLGGLAQVNVLVSMLFAGISGSASADASAIGAMMIPAMIEDGYDRPFSVAVTAASSCIGPIIPPSIVMVIYGSITELSIGQLFAAGLLPGVIIGLAQMGLVWTYAKKRGYKARQRVPFREVLRRGKEAIWGLIAPLIILGGILGGVFTATEAGAIAAVYGVCVGLFIYKDIKIRDLPKVIKESAVMTAIPMLILAYASVFGWVLARQNFSGNMVAWISNLTTNPQVLMLIAAFMLLIVGLFVEGTAAIMIFVPVFMPLITRFSLDPIHFGLVVIVTMLVGTITPPVGLQLYIASSIAGIPITKVKEIWAFTLVMMAVVVAMIFIPALTTWLPGLLFR